MEDTSSLRNSLFSRRFLSSRVVVFPFVERFAPFPLASSPQETRPVAFAHRKRPDEAEEVPDRLLARVPLPLDGLVDSVPDGRR